VNAVYSELDELLLEMMTGGIPDKYFIVKNRFFTPYYQGKIVMRYVKPLQISYSYARHPASLGILFNGSNISDNRLGAAIKRRNSAVREYHDFLLEYAHGRSLYVPWWIEKRTWRKAAGNLLMTVFR
jgi:hypothetical protein